MNRIEIENLLKKYREDRCTAEEISLLESQIFSANGKPEFADEVIIEVKNEIRENLLSIVQPHAPDVKSTRLWPRIAVAAAAVAAITLGTWLYYASNMSGSLSRGTKGSLAYAEDIKPGSVGATLTLANGKTIKLSDATNGELAKEAGVTITKSADGQLIYDMSSSRGTEGYLDPATSRDPSKVGMTKGAEMTNTLSTAKGETYQVKLPDGTAVWLNAASSLTYSASLTAHGKRVVRLTGEAYFKVAKDKMHPFIVESKGQRVEVLGTHFNINAYADEGNTKTTLLEGSVAVSSMRGIDPSSSRELRSKPISKGEAVTLRPNEQSILKGEALQVKQVNASEAIAWKNGSFKFNGENIRSIMNTLQRWYDIEVRYEGKVPIELYYGDISRYKNISEVLKMLEKAQGVHFKVEGRRVTVID